MDTRPVFDVSYERNWVYLQVLILLATIVLFGCASSTEFLDNNDFEQNHVNWNFLVGNVNWNFFPFSYQKFIFKLFSTSLLAALHSS